MTDTEIKVALALLALAGTVGGSFLGARLAYGTYRSQRAWDRKSDSYRAIFDAINTALEENDPLWHAHVEEQEITPERKAELAAASELAWKEIRRQSRIGDFLISHESKLIIDHLLERIEVATAADTYFEHIDKIGAALSDALRDLSKSARKDLSS